jgi:TolB-like protein
MTRLLEPPDLLSLRRLTPIVAFVFGAGCATNAGRVSPERVVEAESYARRAVATEQSIRADTIPQRTVGVTPLRAPANDTLLEPLSFGLADLLMTDLSRSKQLQIVDRLRLEALLRELNLATSGRVEPASAPRVGRLVQARRLVIGNLNRGTNGQVRIDARVADVASSEVRNAISASAALADILRAEKDLALRILQELNITLTPAERAEIEQRPTANFAALLAYSRGVQYETQGRYDEAAAEFEKARKIDPEFVSAALRARMQNRGPQGAPAITRVASVGSAAAERVNPTAPFLLPRPGSIADVAFPAQTVTVIVTITTRP